MERNRKSSNGTGESKFTLHSLKRGNCCQALSVPDAKRQQLSFYSASFDESQLFGYGRYICGEPSECICHSSPHILEKRTETCRLTEKSLIEIGAGQNTSYVRGDEDVADCQLLYNLPTSVDEFSSHELNLKLGRTENSPTFRSADDSFDGYSFVRNPLNCGAFSKCRAISESSGIVVEDPDEDDLEVAMINETFEQQERQLQIYKDEKLKSIFYSNGSNTSNQALDGVDTELVDLAGSLSGPSKSQPNGSAFEHPSFVVPAGEPIYPISADHFVLTDFAAELVGISPMKKTDSLNSKMLDIELQKMIIDEPRLVFSSTLSFISFDTDSFLFAASQTEFPKYDADDTSKFVLPATHQHHNYQDVKNRTNKKNSSNDALDGGLNADNDSSSSDEAIVINNSDELLDDESAKQVAFAVVASLFSSPLADRRQIKGTSEPETQNCSSPSPFSLDQSSSSLDPPENPASTTVDDMENVILSDSMLLEIQNELIDLLDGDQFTEDEEKTFEGNNQSSDDGIRNAADNSSSSPTAAFRPFDGSSSSPATDLCDGDSAAMGEKRRSDSESSTDSAGTPSAEQKVPVWRDSWLWSSNIPTPLSEPEYDSFFKEPIISNDELLSRSFHLLSGASTNSLGIGSESRVFHTQIEDYNSSGEINSWENRCSTVDIPTDFDTFITPTMVAPTHQCRVPINKASPFGPKYH